MKLYEILFRHYAPRGSQKGTLGYVVAESNEQVYDFIRSEPTLKNGSSMYVDWMCKDNPEEEEYEENFKKRIIGCCGEMFDDEVELCDLYYGLTHYGWNCINENITDIQIGVLNDIGINVDVCKE